MRCSRLLLPLFLLLSFPLFLPLGKLPLSFLTLEKGLYLREQDTGQSLYLMVGYPSAVVVGPLFTWHGITPLNLLLVKQICLKYGAVGSDETSLRVFRNTLSSTGIVQDNLRQYIIRLTADTEIHVIFNLPGNNIGIRPLGGKD